MSISVYSFEDREGHEDGTYQTQCYRDAQEHARRYGLRLIDNIYEWQEAIPVEGDDYTEPDENEEDEPLHPGA
jgi:hypothetical protein